MNIKDFFQQQIQGLKEQGAKSAQLAKNMEIDLNDSEEVIVRPYAEHDVVKDIVDAFLKSGKPIERQECFENSAALAHFDERIQYVEGHALAYSNILIDHAWNRYGDFHFDLTAELALKISFGGYLAAQVLDGMDIP